MLADLPGRMYMYKIDKYESHTLMRCKLDSYLSDNYMYDSNCSYMYCYIKKSHRLLGVDTGVLEALTPELAILGVLARQLDALLITDDRRTSVRRNTLLYMTYVRF